MKTTLITLIFGASLIGLTQAEWTTVLRQEQVATGVEYMAVVPDVSSRLSFVPLEEEGAIFELWGLNDGSGSAASGESSQAATDGKSNNGHGNNYDGVDISNPGKGKGGPTGKKNSGEDPSEPIDDEMKGGGGQGSSTITTESLVSPGAGSYYEEHLIDTEFVDVYMPSAAVTVITDDMSGPVPRTRCDQSFSVTYDVAGLLSDTQGHEAAGKVRILHHGDSYAEPHFTEANKTGSEQLFDHNITQNGAHLVTFGASNLPGDTLHRFGVERFEVHALADQSVPSTLLDSAQVHIFPMAVVEIDGVVSNKVYEVAPDFDVVGTDLYPKSSTWVQFYPGSPQLGTEGTLLPDSTIVVDDVRTVNKTAEVRNWDSMIDAEGQWTIEVVHETPFGVERLDYVSFYIDRTIEVNAALLGSE